MRTPDSRPAYGSFTASHRDVYQHAVRETRLAGRTGATMLLAEQDARDWSDAPTPDLVMAQAPRHSAASIFDPGAGRLRAPPLSHGSGVRDRLPPVEDAVKHVREGIIRQCPVCDAYEVRDRPIAVSGAGACAAGEALFLRSYSPDITVVTLGAPLGLDEEDAARLREAGIDVVETPLKRLHCEAGCVTAHLETGGPLRFEAAYSGLRIKPSTGLGEMLGVELTEDRRFVTDPKQRTTQPGVHAAATRSPDSIRLRWPWRRRRLLPPRSTTRSGGPSSSVFASDAPQPAS